MTTNMRIIIMTTKIATMKIITTFITRSAIMTRRRTSTTFVNGIFEQSMDDA
jgi:hypothetical protein